MKAMHMMSALSQTTRFDVFSRLVEALPGGVASGDLAAATNTAPSAMSAHLAILARAGLVTSDRVGKTVIYQAVTSSIAELAELLAFKFLRADQQRQTVCRRVRQ